MGGPTERSRAETFPKTARVRRRSEFLTLGRTGRRFATQNFLLLHASAGSGPARLGITVTRKIGNAVLRNRIKRAVRETFRRCRTRLPDGLAMVVIARSGAARASSQAIAGELIPAFEGIAARASRGLSKRRGEEH